MIKIKGRVLNLFEEMPHKNDFFIWIIVKRVTFKMAE